MIPKLKKLPTETISPLDDYCRTMNRVREMIRKKRKERINICEYCHKKIAYEGLFLSFYEPYPNKYRAQEFEAKVLSNSKYWRCSHKVCWERDGIVLFKPQKSVNFL